MALPTWRGTNPINIKVRLFHNQLKTSSSFSFLLGQEQLFDIWTDHILNLGATSTDAA